MKTSYIFTDDKELLDFIIWEVKKYTGCTELSKVLFTYNRLTVEELAQEVYVKLLRTVSPMGFNKSFVRQAVVFVCIDEYRRFRIYDVPRSTTDPEDWEPNAQEALEITEEETYGLTERLMQLDLFTDRELSVVLLLIEGHRNPVIRDTLGIPKMTYYTLLKRIKERLLELQIPSLEEEIEGLFTTKDKLF